MRAAGILVLLLLTGGVRAQADEPAPEMPPAPSLPAPEGVTAQRRDEALKRALKVLDEDLAKRFGAYEQQGVFASAVAGWAFLLLEERGPSQPALPGRGKALARLAGHVGQYLEKVERFVRREEVPAEPAAPRGLGDMGHNDGVQCNWPTAVAGLFFAEALQRGKLRAEAKPACARALAILEATQQADGGWGHDDGRRGGIGGIELPIPDPTGRRGKLDYPKTLLATSNVCATALGALKRALKKDGGESVTKARAYFAKAQNGDGSFPYDPSQSRNLPEGARGLGPVDVISAPVTAGALLALRSLGADHEACGTQALAFVERNADHLGEGHGSATFGLMLSALEASTRGEEAWKAFRERHLGRVVDAQGTTGTFLCACRRGRAGTTCDTEPLPGGMQLPGHDEDSRMYVTALHTLVLALDRMPAKSLPPAKKPAAGPAVTPR